MEGRQKHIRSIVASMPMETVMALAFAGSVRLGKSTADRERLDMVKIRTAQAELWRIGVAQLL